MKVIFLDFDGVLNSERYFHAHGYEGLMLDPACLERLKLLVGITDAKIVLSTSWREHWEKEKSNCSAIGLEMNEIFKKYGLKIFDKTPFSGIDRESDIEEWLKRHPKTSNFVVLDDRILDSAVIRGHFVKTDPYLYGFHDSALENAVLILKKGQE